jgi:uncharacterized protein YbaR (Trm112 family)
MVKDAYTVDMMQQSISSEVLALLACPVCYGALSVADSHILCSGCSRRYPVEDGIPILLAERAQVDAVLLNGDGDAQKDK